MMRKARIFNFGILAGTLEEIEKGRSYRFSYVVDYRGTPISQTLPLGPAEYTYQEFPPFFYGLLPEGIQLESLLSLTKSDRNDHFSHLMIVGKDLVGSVTVQEEL